MKRFSILMAMVLVVSLVALALPTVSLAAPSGGVYDIAVLEVGNVARWTVDDFNQLDVAPGIESYTWTTISTSELTGPGLAPYDVLIIPMHHDYSWLYSAEKSAIVAWVNSGKLLIEHHYSNGNALINEPLMAAFGPNYRVDWTGEKGVEGEVSDSVVIIDPTNPLVTTPNTLNAAELSNWHLTVHNSINRTTAGSALRWAIDSAGGDHWLGYAHSQSGAIVVCGGDPGYHSGPINIEAASKLIENEIVTVEAKIPTAIKDGVTWLVAQQDPIDGSWGEEESLDRKIGKTSFAVVKLEDLAFELGYESPFDPAYKYSSNVTAGLDYLFSQVTSDTCGIHFGVVSHTTYATGTAMMAIAAGKDMNRVVSVGNPVIDGMTYGQVLEANVDYFANSQQSDSDRGKGGWCYGCGTWWADNSNSGYAVLGLRYAETAGIDIPQTLKDNLSSWIDIIQDDMDGDVYDGGSGYSLRYFNIDDDGDGLIDEDPLDGLDNDGDGLIDEDRGLHWVNVLKTGNLLFQMAFVGDTPATQRVQDAIDFIERHWDDPVPSQGWRPHDYQAMYCLMKGLESFNIQTIEVGGSPIDWYDQFVDAIIATQIYGGPLGDGYWPANQWGDELLSTEWALFTLERVVPPFEVDIDIKPGSDPNSINLISKGVIPVAILTTDFFNALTVDPVTVLFADAQPVRWAVEDVDYDGDLDLVLHFKTQETDIIAVDTEAILSGQTFDGVPITGTDSVHTVPTL